MADRYSRLFSLEKRLYAHGSPVIIMAGALLRDSFSSNLLAQLKFRNISSRELLALKVSVTMLDIAGRRIGEPVEYQYLDIHARRDDEFGRDTAIVLPDAAARSFSVLVSEAAFDDGSLWRADGSPWAALKGQPSLAEAYGDGELAEQYRVRYGSDCRFTPLEDGELWFCTCGAVNSAGEKICHICRRALLAQKSVNLSALRAECAERLKAEQQHQAEENEQNRKKKKRRLKLAAIMAPLLLAAVFILATVPGAVKKSRAYDAAAELLAQNQFDQAAQAFSALGDYRDSARQAEMNVPYRLALYIMDCAAREDTAALALAGLSAADVEEGQLSAVLYQAAAERFAALGDYMDSAFRAEQCQKAITAGEENDVRTAYDEAKALLDSGAYCAARDAFKALGSYSDSADMVREAIYQKAVALYGIMEKYDVRELYASISTQTGKASVFSFNESAAMKLGSGFIEELRAACGQDEADIRMEDKPSETLIPFSGALNRLFATMKPYSDSAGYMEKISAAVDYTREFYGLLANGDIYGAYDWLSVYEGEFEGRDYWLGLLESYKPFCGTWELYSGDAALLPLTAGSTQPCGSFSACVIISDEAAILRLSPMNGEDYAVELRAELGASAFTNSDDGVNTYYATISNVQRLAYIKYNAAGLVRSSCEYSKAA